MNIPLLNKKDTLSEWLDKRFPKALVMPSMIFLTLIVIIPLVYLFYISTRSLNISKPQYGNYFLGLGNYIDAILDPKVTKALSLTLILTAMVVSAEFVLGLFIAVLLNRSGKLQNLAQTLILIPFIMTPVINALLWRYMLQPDIGIVNYVLGLIGLSEPTWYANPSLALVTIALVDIWRWTPFMVIILLAGLQRIPLVLYEVAMVDGASFLRIFTGITIPLLKPMIILALAFKLLYSFKIFDTIHVITKGGPGISTQIYNYHLYKVVFRFFYVGYGSALGVILVMLTLLLCLVLVRVISEETGR
jgi:multiple sugar transport system permease protein